MNGRHASREFGCVAQGLRPLGIGTAVINYSLLPKVGIDEITRQACREVFDR